LSYLLVLPLLFFALVAFPVCFGWFTLVYFVSSLLGKCNSHDCLESDSDARELRRNEEQARSREERAGSSVTQGTAGSAMAEVCIGGQQIKEVFADGFSDAFLDMSSMGSPYDCIKKTHDCTKDEEHSCSSCEKVVEEVMAFETDCEEFNEISYLDVTSEKQQIQDTPVDWFVDETSSGEFCTSCGSTNPVHLQLRSNRKEAPVCAAPEILDLIDRHETGAVVVICSDNSAENYVKCGADFPDDISQEVTQDIFHEYQDMQNTVTGDTNKLSEYHHFIEEKGTQSIGTSGEIHDLSNQSEMSGLPIDSVSETEHTTVATSNASSDYADSGKEDAHVQEQHTEANSAEASDSTSLVCDFVQNNEAKSEEIGTPSNEDNVQQVASSEESSAIGKTEVEDESSFTSEVSAKQHYLSCVIDDY
jgi:hypothetical protein